LPIATINGARIHFLQLCEGDARDREDVVMLHGLATNIAFWYFKYACELAKEYRVTVFDMRGHGRSEMTPAGYSPANLAKDVCGLMEHLGIRRAHLLGHSFGGVVAMKYAIEHADRVRSLALADTHIAAARHSQSFSEWEHGRTIQTLLDRHGFDLDACDPYFGYKLLTKVAQNQLSGIATPPDLNDLVYPTTSHTGGRTAAQWLKLMRSTSAESEMMCDDGISREALRRFDFPIIAMYGDRSPARITGRELLEVWPHAEFRTVRNAGHFFPASRPEEVLAACRRLWRADPSENAPKHRAGEPRRSYFRSDRIFKDTSGWYFTTREFPRVGPFAEFEEASSMLMDMILGLLQSAS
jgi:pimeloyl-ACP methyl ester carboxylesterase